MPAVRTYRVTQTREVKVHANSPEDAVRIAAAAFKDGQNSDAGVKQSSELTLLQGVWGNTVTHIRPTDISAYEEI